MCQSIIACKGHMHQGCCCIIKDGYDNPGAGHVEVCEPVCTCISHVFA